MTRRGVGVMATLVMALTWLSAQERTPHVVMISIDGLRPALLADSRLKLPTLRRLMQQGAWARVTGVLPTVNYPSHTTLITGVLPAVHGILDNRIFIPEGLSQQAWYLVRERHQSADAPGCGQGARFDGGRRELARQCGDGARLQRPRDPPVAPPGEPGLDVSTVMAAAPHGVLCVFDRETAGVAPDGRR